MKKALFSAVILFSLFTALVQARVWTDSKGRKVTADYVGMSETDSSKVKLKTANGSVYSFPVSSLSKEDQEYIKSLNKGASDPLNGFGSDDAEGVSEEDSNPNNVVVVVEGAGETLAEAKKDALRCAVEEVVGSLVDAQSRVENDELIEQILTASSAYVEKYSVLSRKIENGLATVKIRATVVKTSLTKKLKLSEGGQTVSIDGASLAGKAATKSESEKNGALFLANFLRKEEFPYRLFDIEFDGKPEITQKGNEIEYKVNIIVSVNRDRYLDFVKRIKPILDKSAISHSSFVVNTRLDNSGNKFFSNEHDIRSFGEPNLPFCICSGVSGDYNSLKFDTYVLPKKFAIPLAYYEGIYPVANISLLDSSKDEIACQRIKLEEQDNIINLMSGFFARYYKYSESIGESTTRLDVNPSYYANKKFDFESDVIVIAPYLTFIQDPVINVDNTVCIYSKLQRTLSIKLSPSELERVKSASVSVIVNNPEMDKAFERMPKEIDKVPTE